MECKQCKQVSDWVGDDSHWTLVNTDSPSVSPLYECDDCGHRQRAR